MRIIIKNGRVIDPASGTDDIRSLFIENDKLAAPFSEEAADELIDASGMVVCPGFIDIHMHEDPVEEDGSIYSDPERSVFSCMLRMGVTTAVGGNCGESHIHPADYLDLVDRCGAPCNVAMLAGHSYFRYASGASDKYGSATPEQISEIAAGIANALDRGCAGVSFGIRYVPGITADELLAAAEPCRTRNKFIAAHIRDDAEAVFSAAEEFLSAAEKLSVPAQVSHIGSMAGFGQMRRFLEMIMEYRSKGLDVTCDCYPYNAFSTSIGSTTYDPGWLERYGCDYGVLEISEGTYKGLRCTKEIFDEVRREYPDYKTVCYVMKDTEIRPALEHELVMCASDATMSHGQGHPRAAGTFPRFIAEYCGDNALPLSEGIRKMTLMPAERLGLKNKGSLSIGSDADIVIFDPATIRDNASFTEPTLPPSGIERVLIGGRTALVKGKMIESGLGRAVRT